LYDIYVINEIAIILTIMNTIMLNFFKHDKSANERKKERGQKYV